MSASMTYLLPCPSCGSKLPVETGQAGQMLRCGCGQSVEVPTVRGLRELEVVADDGSAPRWTARHGLVFVGSVIAMAALLFAGYIWMTRPPAYDATSLPVELDEAAIKT